jgi:uncharacterized sulfatase
MVRWPGKVEPRKSDALATSLDFAPTILAAAGLETPKDLPGLNLLDDAKTKARNTLFGECFTHNAVDLDRPASGLRWRWMIEGAWKLIVPAPENEPKEKVELFDLAADPLEKANLAEKEGERVKRMRAALDAWWEGK